MGDISVFTTGPSCMKCKLTKKRLADKGLPFTEVRVDQNPAVADTLRRLADAGEITTTMPVVHATEHDVFWSDFRPTQIDALLALYATETGVPVGSEELAA